jgi:site-specific DNA-methyltransferase (cytosine-N4-specific)
MLRSYLPKGHPLKPLELGSERTPQEYVANMVRVFGLVREALADHGTVWLNVGDTYLHSRGKRKPGDKHGPKQCSNAGSVAMPSATADGIAEGNMGLIPWRLALALQDDDWIVRSVIVWRKPAPMPSSVSGWAWRRCRLLVRPRGASNSRASAKPGEGTGGKSPRNPDSSRNPELQAQWSDCPGCNKCKPHGGYVLRRGSWRPTSSWEPILMLAKSPRYFCDGEAVKTPAAQATIDRNEYTRILDDPDEQFAVRHDHETLPTTANLRDVWTIAAEPLKEKHYAAFPTELVGRCLRAGTSAKGYCPTCGGPWVRVIVAQEYGDYIGPDRSNGLRPTENRRHMMGENFYANYKPPETIGWRPSCSCPEQEPRPGVVLDPFAGSGRTGIEARRLGLDFVGVELNPAYVEMGSRLLVADAPLFNGVPPCQS